MKTIRQTYSIKAPIERVWQALVDPKEIEGWGAGPAEMDDKVGTLFKLWGGDVHGKNVEVIEDKRLVQEWYGGDWPEPSKVTISLQADGDDTVLNLVHEDIPDKEAGSIDDGWNRYYFGEMKKYLEKG